MRRADVFSFFSNRTPLVFSAPMADVSNPAFRMLCEMHGADFTYTEMINADGLVHNSSFSENHGFSISGRPYAVQISGNRSESMCKAVSMVEDMFHPSLIDINMGCPSPRVTKNGCGASLMKKDGLASKIIEDICSVTKTPISAKIRVFEKTQDTISFAKSLEDAGISFLTIHGRTKKMMYSGRADTDQIRAVRESLFIPVIANGDVSDGVSAYSMFKKTGCFAVMVGRASIGNPYIFNKIKRFFKRVSETEEYDGFNSCGRNGFDSSSSKEVDLINSEIFSHQIDSSEIRQRISDFKEYCRLLETYRLYPYVNIKAHAQWFTRGLPESAALRLRINDLHKGIKISFTQKEDLEQDRLILAEKIINLFDAYF